MSIPASTEVLVVGGGPGGSYAASVLAREGVDVVLLESDVFPRYHIGESQLPSIRYFLRFIDLDSEFDAYGFTQKNGAVFALDHSTAPAYTDFVKANGPDGYSWNVIRAESDHLLLKHAAKSGARVFEGTKVSELTFEPWGVDGGDDESADARQRKGDAPWGRPVAAKWSARDGTSHGTIGFRYLVDASGRYGLVSTKYMKNRKFNQSLKHIGVWGYWEGAPPYGDAHRPDRNGAPYFEALRDQTGWVWAIPLHNGKLSVGVVSRQAVYAEKKKAWEASTADYYHRTIQEQAPAIAARLAKARLVSTIDTASDYSYSASTYASPYLRLVGDAGCFIDPYFSSGCHLAFCSGLAAALTIQASRRGQCAEDVAARWHSHKVADGYTRFLAVVLATMKQIGVGGDPILQDFDEGGWDRAFGLFQPIIQGTADRNKFANGDVTQEDVNNTFDFCKQAFRKEIVTPAQEKEVCERFKVPDPLLIPPETMLSLSEEDTKLVRALQVQKIFRSHEFSDISGVLGTVDNMTAVVERGNLGLNHIH